MAESLISPIVGSVAGSIFSNLLSSGQSTPAQSGPATMPISDDAAAAAAKKKSIAAQIARRGRASTILTGSDSSDTLG